MQKTAAVEAYRRFLKRAEQEQQIDPEMLEQYLSMPQIQEMQQQADLDAFGDPNYESPLERKRKMQGAGSAIGSGAGMLGGALSGALIPKSTLGKVIGGVGGGLGGLGLGGLGGWGAGSLLARARMGRDYPEE
jgi:hypothetical protein